MYTEIVFADAVVVVAVAVAAVVAEAVVVVVVVLNYDNTDHWVWDGSYLGFFSTSEHS